MAGRDGDMKKLINSPDDVVAEALRGMAAAHPDLLRVRFDPNFVARADAPVAGKVAVLSRRVNAAGRSMGMALTSCTVPHAGRPTFDLPADEMEVGVGIHGEPGRERMKLRPADEVVELLMGPILADLPYRAGDRVLLFVNGLGGTPLIELYVVYRKAAEVARAAGLAVERSLVGSYMTSLDMAGASITLLRLDDEMVRLWDAPVHTAA